MLIEPVDPLLISRRRFFFFGLAATIVAAVPKILQPTLEEIASLSPLSEVIDYDAFLKCTLEKYRPILEKNLLSHRSIVDALMWDNDDHLLLANERSL